MRLKSFLGLVEIRTKVASVIPFLSGTIYALYNFRKFNPLNFILFFGAMILIDMATTALNNFFDYRRAHKKHGYNYETHNTIVKDRIKESRVIAVIFIMLALAVVLGLLLTLNTNLTVLAVGALSFAVGILYSFGPVPISKTPLGEVFSGFFMGFVIIFLSVYIHVFDDGIASLSIRNFNLSLNMNLLEIIYIFLYSLPALCGIANIMLANNICDIEDDVANRRYTLPVYIGKQNALRLFKGLYYAAYLDIVLLAVLGLVPVLCLLSLLTLVPVSKNIKIFYGIQTKKDTFPLSVKNFLIMSTALLVLFWTVWIISSLIPVR